MGRCRRKSGVWERIRDEIGGMAVNIGFEAGFGEWIVDDGRRILDIIR